MGYRWIKVLRQSRNRGKAAALNRALETAQHELIVTLDADAILFGDALWSMVERYVAAEPDVRAVSGCVLVRNSRDNWLTRAQEWDYFHGLASMKRMQSRYQGTVVADAAFTIYDRAGAERTRRLALRRRRRRAADVGHAAERLAHRFRRGRVLLRHRSRRSQVLAAPARAPCARDAARAARAAKRTDQAPPHLDAVRRLAPAVSVDRSCIHARLCSGCRSCPSRTAVTC